MSVRRAIRSRYAAFRKRIIFRLINFWPPFLGAGIRVTRSRIVDGIVEVRLKLRWWNRNYVGTHYGGSLYSMCDPFFMLILMEHLGSGFTVWDKAATIRFRTPGRGTVRATFEIPFDEIERIREEAIRDGKSEPVFTAQVLDEDEQVVAEVEKRVHVKKNRKKKAPPRPS